MLRAKGRREEVLKLLSLGCAFTQPKFTAEFLMSCSIY